MKRKKKPGYFTLLSSTVLFVLGAVLTMMPVSYSYRECMLGYKAHCTLTPVSTVSCLAVAAITWVVARTYFTEAR
jgi:hypothetical protein